MKYSYLFIFSNFNFIVMKATMTKSFFQTAFLLFSSYLLILIALEMIYR